MTNYKGLNITLEAFGEFPPPALLRSAESFPNRRINKNINVFSHVSVYLQVVAVSSYCV